MFEALKFQIWLFLKSFTDKYDTDKKLIIILKKGITEKKTQRKTKKSIKRRHE